MADNVLSGWKNGPAKLAIVDFVTSSTQDGLAFVAPARAKGFKAGLAGMGG